MKTKKILFSLLLLLSIHAFAQDSKNDKKEQIRTLKVGYITNELALTTEEAAKFWPIYNAFDDRQFDIKNDKMKAFKNRMSEETLDKLTEKEAAILLAQMESADDELYQLRKKFISNLKGVLPAVKIIKLKKAEDDFKKKLLQQYRNKGPRN